MNLHVGTGSHLDSIVAKLDAWFGGLLTFLPAYIKKHHFQQHPDRGQVSRKMMNNMYKFNVYINMGSEHRQ